MATDPGSEQTGPGGSWDEALARLEDVLIQYPYDRALPDLTRILADAGVTEDYLHSDERALKVLHEAVVARPLASTDAVSRVRTEVELLTLEVRVLAERLVDPATSEDEARRVRSRLARVRGRLAEVRSLV